MRQSPSELKSGLVDLTGMSLDEVRSSTDPALLRSVLVFADKTERSRPVSLQNQAETEG